MTGARRVIIVLVVVFTSVGCDQATKTYANRSLSGKVPVGVVGELFQLQYTENTGAMMGVGGDLPASVRFWILIVFAGCALVAILAYTLLSKGLRFVEIIALALIIGGGTGNLIDRLFKGGVVIDFMILTLGFLKTAIFNIADTAVITGLLLLLLSNLPGITKQSIKEPHS